MCDLLLSVLKKCYILRVGQVKIFFIHWPLKVFFYFTVVGQVTLSSDAQGNSIEVGSSITYTCMLDQRYSQNDVIWMRKTGSISLDLTSNDGHLVPSLASGRYSSASSTDSDGNKLHQLIIRRKSKFLNSLHTGFFFKGKLINKICFRYHPLQRQLWCVVSWYFNSWHAEFF